MADTATTTLAEFGLVELDVLTTYAGATVPFPLRVPSFGRLPGERDVLFATAGATLQHRGMATDDGPTGIARELTAAFKNRRATIDLVLTGPGAPDGVVAVIHQDRALLCRQHLDDSHTAMVGVEPVRLDNLADTLLNLIPTAPAAKIIPVRVPAAAVHAVHTATANHPNGNLGNLLHRIATHYGCTVADLDALIRAGSGVTNGGQLGATRMSSHRTDTRVGAELSWLDGSIGRVRVSSHRHNGHDWISVNTLRPNDMRAAITELVTLVRHT